MGKLSVRDLKPRGKRVLVRVDFNVPLQNGQVADATRIRESLPTIRLLRDEGAKIILCSHLGRPKGKRDPQFSLAPVASELKELLGLPVQFANDCVGEEVERLVHSLKDGDIVLLENLRFHAQEEKNDAEFAKQLARLADVYVNDAFGAAHRAHASTAGVCAFVAQAAAGLLVEKELDFLSRATSHPQRPYVAILGGAKISGKIDVVTNLFGKVDSILIGGAMANTFFKSLGWETGQSLVEMDRVDLARELLERAKREHVDLRLPVDCVAATKFAEDAGAMVVRADAMPADRTMMDIGPATVADYREHILRAKTVLWNGPMGVFEMERFAAGTKGVAQALAEATPKGATTIVGGGDSAAAIAKFGFADQVSHVSTGGGASLEFLEGKVLPGVAALTDASS
ncbi:MAG TPA: phosphoglycerate kinase [bacterium]|nr:phosphoglycerate kinase [bacterium]